MTPLHCSCSPRWPTLRRAGSWSREAAKPSSRWAGWAGERGGRKVYYARSFLRLWDAPQGLVRLTLPEEKEVRTKSLAFSPDGKTLAVAVQKLRQAGAGEVRLFDVNKGELGAVRQTIPAGG